MALLLGWIVLVTLTGSTLLYFGLDAFPSYSDALWWTMDHLFDPGALSEDQGWTQRIAGLALVAAGLIILVGILVTLATEVVDRSLERLASADLPVEAHQHLLFVGWDDTTPDIFQTLDYLRNHLVAGAQSPFRSIVVLAPDSLRDRRAQIQSTLRQAIPSITTQVAFGNVLQPDSYERTAAQGRRIRASAPPTPTPCRLRRHSPGISTRGTARLPTRRRSSASCSTPASTPTRRRRSSHRTSMTWFSIGLSPACSRWS